MTYDLARIRSDFPALEHGVAHFDGPGGSQTPRQVADAVSATLTAGLANRGSVTDAERRAEDVTRAARAAMADFLGAEAEGVVFGRSMTQLTFDLARTLAQGWGAGDEIVVTRLDHDANIRPWVLAAGRAGATVRWLDFDPATAELDDIAPLLSERTRLVAVTGASNLFGTRPDVAAIAAQAHAVGALVHVDAVHLAAHAAVDKAGLGADFVACSPYKFFGPHHGVLAASAALLETLHPEKLLPSSDAVPERFELGTLPYEMLAGTTAAVDYIAGLASDAEDRRTAVVESMTALDEHETRLMARLLDGLGDLDRVTLHGRPARRTPTALFTVDGLSPREVHEGLAKVGVNAPASHFYALEASRHTGLGDAGGVRVGLAAYTSEDDVNRLVRGLQGLLSSAG
ncbi:cysteine desulfurase-like protein [Nocardioides panaciterrulae]|uniref:Cysteine desulfurase family protein (TIGR01976 family) n=1 Tax=Nocardioides panaciterrulae TaxID=661492 RepID=A0A7Y9JC00_9ACTN|nr:cysteine desulfurase family protein (TIGR01976 family) [Nocardioides panaciterrulae]